MFSACFFFWCIVSDYTILSVFYLTPDNFCLYLLSLINFASALCFLFLSMFYWEPLLLCLFLHWLSSVLLFWLQYTLMFCFHLAIFCFCLFVTVLNFLCSVVFLFILCPRSYLLMVVFVCYRYSKYFVNKIKGKTYRISIVFCVLISPFFTMFLLCFDRVYSMFCSLLFCTFIYKI